MSCMSAYSMPLCTIFTKWPGAVGADVGAARGAVDVGRDRLDHRPEPLVGVLRAADHDRGAVERALLAAGDTHADEVQAVLGQRLLAADGVDEVRVAGVHDDVVLVQQRHELVDHGVGRPRRP